MGSWNATCGITQLPIISGQRIVAIPLVVKQHDFLARDSLAGSGACDNDLIAQPFALPVFGEYDDYGGIKLDDNQPGVAYLTKAFQALVKAGRLLKHPNGKPVPVKKASDELLDELMRRELLVNVPNQRKAWLKKLHELYASLPLEQQKGMGHYKAQMEVDPATLPDDIPFGLGVMFVPEALYLSLADAVGAEGAYGYYDHDEDVMVAFKGTRRDELSQMATLDGEGKAKLDKMTQMLDVHGAEFSEEQKALLLSTVSSLALQYAHKTSGRCFFFDDAVSAALSDLVVNDNGAARTLWVDFILFHSAMNAMRKQWTPQAGAGMSSGLYETHTLYQVANDFMSQTLAKCQAARGEAE